MFGDDGTLYRNPGHGPEKKNSLIQAWLSRQIIVIIMHVTGQNLVSFATLKLQSKTVEQYNI